MKAQMDMPDFLCSLPDRLKADFHAHNEASAELWTAFAENKHKRVPVRLNSNPRVLLLDPRHNKRGFTYRDYMTDPDLMAEVVLEWQYWSRFMLETDAPRGLPDSWQLNLDFENHYDAAWLGCQVNYHYWQVPYASPLLDEDNKRMLFDAGPPGPFDGEWAVRALAFFEHWQMKSKQGWSFLGRPVDPPSVAPFVSNDGIFTLAASLRGATGICMDMLTDPQYVHELMQFLSEALAARMRAWRELLGIPQGRLDGYFWADDSIQMLSVEQYREFVLPWHRRMYDEFATETGRGMHLCGNVQRHLPVIRDELRVLSFDTGFPIDFETLRAELGTGVTISGGPPAAMFVQDDEKAMEKRVGHICRSGILEGGRFILQEANNLPPCACLNTCRAFYEAGVRYGRL